MLQDLLGEVQELMENGYESDSEPLLKQVRAMSCQMGQPCVLYWFNTL